jgi:hypothetical protein
MKKILLGALLLSSAAAFAQSENVEIVNTTGCRAYLYFALSEPLSPCLQYHTSDVIAIDPGQTLTYNYTNYPGSTASAPQYFAYVKVLSGPLYCATTAVTVGAPCAYPNATGTVPLYSGEYCEEFCAVANVEWVNDSNPAGTCVLKIYP